jgi:hypothetical protein
MGDSRCCSSSRTPSLCDACELTHRHGKLEYSFCHDFWCCDTFLSDLHELLQHYEEHHAPTTDEHLYMDFADTNYIASRVMTSTINPMFTFVSPDQDDEDDMPSSDTYSTGSSEYSVPSTPPPASPPAQKRRKRMRDDDNGVEALALDDLEQLLRENHMLFYNPEDSLDRPYKCAVEGCGKAYKNANGLKYHKMHGHCGDLDTDADPSIEKPYQCVMTSCQKRYKNLNGLKYHYQHTHLQHLRIQQQNNSYAV